MLGRPGIEVNGKVRVISKVRVAGARYTLVLLILVILFILLQILVFHDNNLKNKKFYMDKLAIANIEMDQATLFADSEVCKKNLRSIVNRVYILLFLEYNFSIILNSIVSHKELLVDIREEIFGFILAYFSESKYKSIYTYTYTYTCC
ncbi:MAG: hypothetical protein HPY74_13945 [Firmicutes bacterium]|nr:hypothetical protein [Bacillota bacterium]